MFEYSDTRPPKSRYILHCFVASLTERVVCAGSVLPGCSNSRELSAVEWGRAERKTASWRVQYGANFLLRSFFRKLRPRNKNGIEIRYGLVLARCYKLLVPQCTPVNLGNGEATHHSLRPRRKM